MRTPATSSVPLPSKSALVVTSTVPPVSPMKETCCVGTRERVEDELVAGEDATMQCIDVDALRVELADPEDEAVGGAVVTVVEPVGVEPAAYDVGSVAQRDGVGPGLALDEVGPVAAGNHVVPGTAVDAPPKFLTDYFKGAIIHR